MSPKLKICGITTLEDARFCAAAGVDMIGFVMHPDSPRFVESDQVRDINEWVVGPLSVGVFVDADPDAVNKIARKTRIAMVQLHGNETPESCRAIEYPIIKTIGVSTETSANDLLSQAELYAEVVDYLLFDTSVAGRSGGTGKPFDWSLVAGVSKFFDVFVAGGISSSNVASAVEAVQPFGIDVSSSVEDLPGTKNFEHVTKLIETVRNL